MKLVSSIKSSNFILRHFPEDYENMVYVEPHFGRGSILLNKKPSKEEIINDPDFKIISNLRTVRDQSRYVIRSLNKKKSKEQTVCKKNNSEIEVTINDFIFKKLGTNRATKSFLNDAVDQTRNLSKRLEDVYILNRSPVAILKAFNSQEILIFISLLKIQKEEDSVQEQINLMEQLKVFRGKMILSSLPSNFYSKSFKGWRSAKKTDIWLWMNWR